MTRYLLNSAVLTAPGDYTYRIVTPEVAQGWYAAGDIPISTIGYAETAAALGELLGVEVAVDRRTVVMEPGDSALVFRLVFPPGSPRINPQSKGVLGRALLAGHYELGLLHRPLPVKPRSPNIDLARDLLSRIWPRVSKSIRCPVVLSEDEARAVRGVCAQLAEARGLEREF